MKLALVAIVSAALGDGVMWVVDIQDSGFMIRKMRP
jgi:hypothetical protein